MILFGAGRNGLDALHTYGAENVSYFCDNDTDKIGKCIEGIEILSFDRAVDLVKNGESIMITLGSNWKMIEQLEKSGITDYMEYIKIPYKKNKEDMEYDRYLGNFVNEYRYSDLLNDISILGETVKKIDNDIRIGKSLYHSMQKPETMFYGNRLGLVEYANISHEIVEYGPVVSHYDCIPTMGGQYYNTSVIMSGDYFKEKIHRRYPYVPVFSVGPYIKYVNGIYNNEDFNEIKRKIGSMLLVYLPHSIENVERVFDKRNFIDIVIDNYSKMFDSIWLCVYWKDINSFICSYAESKGIHAVSAGLRFDDMFNKRQRTMLDLSDAVVCGEMGTFIPYALSLKKPVGRIDISYDTPINENDDEYVNYLNMKNDFYELFSMDLTWTEEKVNWIKELAGFDFFRTKDEIRNIYTISKDIWMECDGNTMNYKTAVRNVFDNYIYRNDVEKIELLKEALEDKSK